MPPSTPEDPSAPGPERSAIRLRPWAEGDLTLLRRTNTPEMTEHLGGPESESQVLARHQRYLLPGDPAEGQMFAVVPEAGGSPLGSIGFWERPWRGETVYETGWGILPEHQGHGLASRAATELIDVVRARTRHPRLHAFPSVSHAASNAVCRRAGFRLLGECDFPYPPGSVMRCHDWCLELS